MKIKVSQIVPVIEKVITIVMITRKTLQLVIVIVIIKYLLKQFVIVMITF